MSRINLSVLAFIRDGLYSPEEVTILISVEGAVLSRRVPITVTILKRNRLESGLFCVLIPQRCLLKDAIRINATLRVFIIAMFILLAFITSVIQNQRAIIITCLNFLPFSRFIWISLLYKPILVSDLSVFVDQLRS